MTHQEAIDSAASYALDALEAHARVELEAHLATCAACQAEVRTYREVAGALAYAAPTSAIPHASDLRERILRDARQVRPIASAPAKTGRSSVVPWATAIAALAAAIVFAFVYRGERRMANELRSEIEAMRTLLARDDSTLAALTGPEVHVVSLAAADQKPAVRVFWNHTRHTFVVTALAMPAAPAGKAYQLWAIRKGKPPMSMGTFDADPSGRTTTTLVVAPEITDGGFIDDCALTVEPVGGSVQPTEAPRLVGSWRHVD